MSLVSLHGIRVNSWQGRFSRLFIIHNARSFAPCPDTCCHEVSDWVARLLSVTLRIVTWPSVRIQWRKRASYRQRFSSRTLVRGNANAIVCSSYETSFPVVASNTRKGHLVTNFLLACAWIVPACSFEEDSKVLDARWNSVVRSAYTSCYEVINGKSRLFFRCFSTVRKILDSARKEGAYCSSWKVNRICTRFDALKCIHILYLWVKSLRIFRLDTSWL